MKLRDKILYMSFGAGLVVLGMVLNSLVSGDAEAQEGLKNGKFGVVVCKGLGILDGNNRMRGLFGLSDGGEVALRIFGDDGKSLVAYLGANDANNEMMFFLKSKSQTDKRMAGIQIDEYGGRFESNNKMEEIVVRIGVGSGFVDTRDKFGYTR